MTDYYFVVEKTYNEEIFEFEETWRSKAYNDRRLAEHFARAKQKGKDKNKIMYHLELRQPENAPRY